MWLNIICMTIWYWYYIGRYRNNTYRPRDHERKKDNFGQRPTLSLQANVESWSVTIFHMINDLQVASKMEQFWQEYIILCSAQGSVGSLRTIVRGNFNIHGTKILLGCCFHQKLKIYDVLSLLYLWWAQKNLFSTWNIDMAGY